MHKSACLSNVDTSRQPNRAKVYGDWLDVFSYRMPEAMEHLADVVEDVYTFESWKEYDLDTPEQFFERMGLFGLNLEQPAKLIRELRKPRSKEKEAIIRRTAEVRKLREEGKTQQEIADQFGVSQQRVSQITSASASKETNRVQISLRKGTDPAKAAQRIREKFGDEFANTLRDALDMHANTSEK